MEKAREVTKALLKDISPRVQYGQALKAEIVQQVAKDLGIKWNLHTAYRPQSSGKVQHMNQTLKQAMSKLCQETTLPWTHTLPFLLLRVRCAPRARTPSLNSAKGRFGENRELRNPEATTRTWTEHLIHHSQVKAAHQLSDAQPETLPVDYPQEDNGGPQPQDGDAQSPQPCFCTPQSLSPPASQGRPEVQASLDGSCPRLRVSAQPPREAFGLVPERTVSGGPLKAPMDPVRGFMTLNRTVGCEAAVGTGAGLAHPLHLRSAPPAMGPSLLSAGNTGPYALTVPALLHPLMQSGWGGYRQQVRAAAAASIAKPSEALRDAAAAHTC
ncbi:hypothetical protein QTO34_018166 [Cnephaeus nilssonii]|uniref:Integrase catalytic domain-containing protein n=1 Tax=Cnephaeus nilssonii TaxID=3371016 RepID=A0AA40LPR5_CNENI|nr:hypothetical protein QTO34_018166 [Eptesicus nilssonii]